MTNYTSNCIARFAAMVTLALIPLTGQSAFAQGVSVPTFHGGNARLGWNARETILTPATVSSSAFGKLWTNELDGMVSGSPLVIADVPIGGKKTNVVYAATENNSVYALNSADGSVIWAKKSLAAPMSNAEFWGLPGEVTHGILSTPVIDEASGTLYACGVHLKGLRHVYLVWALDIRTGALKPGWPVTLSGSYKGSPFTAGQVIQRGALSFVNGWVYVPFGGRGDTPPWRGWIMGVNAKDPSAPQRAFSTSPDTDGAGAWGAGGLSADNSGNLYTVTGNGDFDLDKGGDNLAQSIVRLKADAAGLGFSRLPVDYYTPSNHQQMDDQDDDLGGATALILPDQPNTSTPHLIFTGGKDGIGYLVNRDDLGGVGGELQKLNLFSEIGASYHSGIRSTSAYFDSGPSGRLIFVPGDERGPQGGPGIAALKLTNEGGNGPVRVKRLWSMDSTYDKPTSPFVTSHGAKQGIVWSIDAQDAPETILRAYDALTGKELYNSDQAAPDDELFDGRKFTSPVVANGRVFIGVHGVVCYGLKGKAAGKGKTN